MKLKRLNKSAIVLLIVLTFGGCLGDSNNDPVDVAAGRGFLTEVLNLMEENSIFKYTINWTDFREKVFTAAQPLMTNEDTYRGISEALRMLGDNHSSFITFEGNVLFESSLDCNADNVSTPIVPTDIGYVRLSGFSGSGSSSTVFAESLQNDIRIRDRDNLKGWIVDLRGNSGGNMWPMLAGIGPILGQDTVGFFQDPDGLEFAWQYSNGSAMNNGTALITVSNAYTLLQPNPKVAILLDKLVISSGEAIAVSFVGRANTRSFGTPTCGRTTANQRFDLGNNMSLNLTVVYMADRNKNQFGIPVPVDELIENSDDVINRAIEWLGN